MFEAFIPYQQSDLQFQHVISSSISVNLARPLLKKTFQYSAPGAILVKKGERNALLKTFTIRHPISHAYYLSRVLMAWFYAR